MDFVIIALTQVHSVLISLCGQMGSYYQLKLKKFLAHVPHLHSVGPQQPFKVFFN